MARLSAPASVSKPSNSSTLPNRRSTPSAALEAVSTRPRQAQRRPTKQASYELANHAKAYLEGGQYVSGYDFLYSLLAAGTSISTPAQPYIGFLAPPAYIAFASSMIADPKFTTKARSKDAVRGSDAALRYLKCVHTTLDDPAYPTVRKALSFPAERNRRRVPRHRSAGESLSPGLGSDIERIAGEHANENSLWHRAEDFWHVVGWAFNCSAAHKKRWDRWKLWLDNILDFLEADWEGCVKQARKDETRREAILRETLIWHYMVGDADSINRGMRRRMVKALLATGTPTSRKEYVEIWEKETVELKVKKNDEQVPDDTTFDMEQLGEDNSDEEMEDPQEDTDGDEDLSDGGIENLQDACEQLGGQDAIELRQRLIALLAQVAQALPASFTTLSDLFDNILEDFIHLPIMMFQVLLSTLRLPGDMQMAFNNNLLLPLVSAKLIDYIRYEPTQEQFEKTLLPLKGTTQSFAANAKISLLLEQMFMYMLNEKALSPTDALRKAMEGGIQARQAVRGLHRTKKGHVGEEELAKGIMEASSDRLLGLLEVLKMSAGMPSQVPAGNSKGSDGVTWASFTSGSSLSPPPSDSANEED